MYDFNILNRADFLNKSLTMIVRTTPRSTGKATFLLKDSEVFWLKEVTWEYSTPATQIGSYGWPKTPLKVSINNFLKDQSVLISLG